jgi:hypothetical protein
MVKPDSRLSGCRSMMNALQFIVTLSVNVQLIYSDNKTSAFRQIRFTDGNISGIKKRKR